MNEGELNSPLCVIGTVESSYNSRAQTPRQSTVTDDAPAIIQLRAGLGLEDAVRDLSTWSHIWVISWFHDNEGHWRPTVLPPRSSIRRGVLATRAPRRPNPIGLSATRLERVEGLSLHVRGLDLLNGTPILDIKPYVPYADALPSANNGWLETETLQFETPIDPIPTFTVSFDSIAEEQLAFLEAAGESEVRTELKKRLSLAPRPHAYRRIKAVGKAFRIALGSWRAFFEIEGQRVRVTEIQSGYRAKELYSEESPELHRRFHDKWSR